MKHLKAIAAVPEYVFNGTWRITPEGAITIPMINDWDNGDLCQRADARNILSLFLNHTSVDPGSADRRLTRR